MATDLQVTLSTHERLKPANAAEIMDALELLFANLSIQAGATRELVLTGYLLALEGRPAWAVRDAVRAILRAEVDGLSRAFCPRAPELAGVVADIVAKARQSIADEFVASQWRERLALTAPVVHGALTPEQRKLIAERMKKLGADLAAKSQPVFVARVNPYQGPDIPAELLGAPLTMEPTQSLLNSTLVRGNG
jgi:hypothetical protein